MDGSKLTDLRYCDDERRFWWERLAGIQRARRRAYEADRRVRPGDDHFDLLFAASEARKAERRHQAQLNSKEKKND